MKWINIKTSLPAENTRVLILNIHKEIFFGERQMIFRNDWGWRVIEEGGVLFYASARVNYWMPVPYYPDETDEIKISAFCSNCVSKIIYWTCCLLIKPAEDVAIFDHKDDETCDRYNYQKNCSDGCKKSTGKNKIK